MQKECASPNKADDEDVMLGIECGFLQREHDVLSSVTKIGGTAVYTGGALDAETAKVVENDWTRCGQCGRRMFLLVQAYAPIHDDWNRMLYVFGCNSATCTATSKKKEAQESFCAFSVEYDGVDNEAIDDDTEFGDDLPLEGSRYPAKKDLPPHTFPAVALVVDEEPPAPEEKEEKEEKEEEGQPQLPPSGNNTAVDEATARDIAELETNVDLKDKIQDVNFDAFRERLARCPHQVIRYKRNLLPLFANPDKTIYEDVPTCGECGTTMLVEMQVMPTTLYFLKCDRYCCEESSATASPAVAASSASTAATATAAKHSGPDGMDFSSLTLYACPTCMGRSAATTNEDKEGAVEESAAKKEGTVGAVLTTKDKRRIVRRLPLFVETPPTLEEEKDAQGGRQSLKEMLNDQQGDEDGDDKGGSGEDDTH